jgi:VCBS repeat-containing protein
MNKHLRIALAAFIASTGAIATSGTANAWGCIAVSEEGSYGYSYNFDNQDDAVDRALAECADRTTTSGTCEITECTEGS